MATTTMHFGPEWMRAKPPQTPARPQAPPSPPPPATSNTQQTNASTYSALVTPAAAPEPERRDEFRPFRYSKEAMLRIYKEGGGRGGLGLEVERWEGIVHEVSSEPTALREMGDAEKKLFAGPLNSELRRRQSTDLISTLSSPSDRPRLNHSNTVGGSSIRGFSLMGRRRDSTADQPPLALPRKLSVSNTQGNSPRDGALPSPRTRIGGFASGFDGVLNGGDSWMARRRTSESMLKAGGASAGTRPEGREEDVKGLNIKEVEEDTSVAQNTALQPDLSGTSQQSSPIADALPRDTTTDSPNQRSTLNADSVARRMAGMNLGENERTNANFHPNPVADSLTAGPPPGLDPGSIEWSYLDPQGHVQGPFKADVMQKWFDEGYFTPDLRMKRTHIDRDWTAVGILDRQAAGGKIFLSQFPMSTSPPGLSIRTDSSQNYSPAHEHNTFSGYQPVPTRTLRSATLDPYHNSASPSDSPPSSFGGGRFGNGSPDTSALGGRIGGLYTSDSGFGSHSFTGNVGPFGPVGDPRSSFNNLAPGRTSSLDTFSTYKNNGNSQWPPSMTQNVQHFSGSEHSLATGFNNGIGSGIMSAPMPVTQSHSFTQEPSYGDGTYNTMGSLGTSHDSPIARLPVEANGLGFNNVGINGSHYVQHYPQSPALPQQRSSTSPFVEVLTKVAESPDVRTPVSAVQPENVSSPWGAPELTVVRRPVVEIPTASPVAQAPPAAWSQPPQPARPAPKSKEPSPWLTASLGVVDDGWREIPGPNSLTVSNLGQHNKMYEKVDEDDIAVSAIGEEEEEITAATAPVPVPETSQPAPLAPATAAPHIESPALAVSKAKLKSNAREAHAPAPASAPKPAPPAPIPALKSPSPVPKPAWATEDDATKGTRSLGLREIQEAEAKKAEARKAAERERLARANAPPPAVVEDAQLFTASWGLPTSQAGSRAAVSPRGGEAVGTPAASAPVWTSASTTPAKKTMKEIQEEEERRKKIGLKDSMAATAARRAYAETTFKVVPSAQIGGGAWTTVGANGKTNAPVPASAPPRPTVTPSVSTQAAPTPRPNGTAVRPTVQIVTKAAAATPPRMDDTPAMSSHDFLKWLSDTLKGLNHSVNLEDITQMLLSFPLDPDPTTSEIISDLIYANSTTLDGRRFAAEFVKRRRASGMAGPGTNGNGKVSIADVVKTTPRAAQPEWGFKVVNKKKKGKA
ncbi:uncharacterized protein EDB91DRAFT_270280 [Suillus paluster]|uniref:uncharacterized protein n=1 Tax=Suillus paluster TaxID=48578 RepID=UPI001B87F673|nr:uncharacterized protein EDB91DRAFT_270280 [Suillus paluster]KAG1755061.1 hypothetical protein EDB91DRAFT_270280 [Suillus paluster]